MSRLPITPDSTIDSDPRGARPDVIPVFATVRSGIDRFLALRTPWAASIGAILLLQSWLTLTHQPWLDEYQALQIALQTPDLASLSANLHYEGHPPLWYLLLRAAAGIVPARWALSSVALVLALATQSIMLLRAPFPRIDRVMIATSAIILFEYGVVSRSLTLGVALLVVAFAFRDRRWSWIALALLPQADFLFGLLSVVLLVIQWRERRWWWPGVALWMVVSLTAVLAVVPAPDVVPAFPREEPLTAIGIWLARLSFMLVPVQMDGWRPTWNHSLHAGVALVAGLLFLLFMFRQTRSHAPHRWMLFGFAAATLLFSAVVYPLSIRHLSLIALLLILLKWREVSNGQPADRAWRIWLAALALGGLGEVAAAVTMPFNTADAAAEAIRVRGLTRKHWISFPESRAQGVAAINGMTFDRLERDCAQGFVRWNSRSNVKGVRGLSARLRRTTDHYGRVYLLTTRNIVPGPDSIYTLITSIPAGYDGQRYNLYLVGRNLPETDRRAPPCVPGLRPLRLLD